jgi:S-adenosylmethionine hydrolase
MHPTIAFLTDFGTRDHYVGAMKGAALTVCPDATLVDITHDIPPHDVLAGALALAAAWKYFPAGTVFVAVVDPGVGTARRAVAASVGACFFVAPDNGLLTLVFRDSPPAQIVELSDPRFARPIVSRTFEGRDRFAPAAAWLATGIALPSLGRPIDDCVQLDVPAPVATPAAIAGVVLQVDRFGNLITNIDRAILERFADGAAVRVTAGSHEIGTLAGTYAEAQPGAACALVGSSDRLEIAVNGGSAAKRFGLVRGAPVIVTRQS